MSTIVETLSLPNYLDKNIAAVMELGADAAAGQAVVNLLNTADVTDNDFLVLLPGAETAELRQIATSGVTGQNVTFTANLSLLHRNHEKIIKLFGNQIKIYRAPNIDGTPPADSVFQANPLGAAAIQADSEYSLFTDNAGGQDFWYKWTYYNTFTHAETDLSLSIPTRGGGWGNYASIEDIKTETGLKEARNLEDVQVAQRRAEAESEIDGSLVAADYAMPLQTQSGIPYIPELIVGVDRLLSAGLILQQNFGTTKPGSAKDGKAKCDQARETIAKIQIGDIVLLDSNKQPLLRNTLLNGYPDDTTMDDGINVGATINMDTVF